MELIQAVVPYIGALLTFVAALLALRDQNTWDSHKRPVLGFIRLTKTGWSLLFVALVAFLIAFIQTSMAQSEQVNQRNREAQLTYYTMSMVYEPLHRLMALTLPFQLAVFKEGVFPTGDISDIFKKSIIEEFDSQLKVFNEDFHYDDSHPYFIDEMSVFLTNRGVIGTKIEQWLTGGNNYFDLENSIDVWAEEYNFFLNQLHLAISMFGGKISEDALIVLQKLQRHPLVLNSNILTSEFPYSGFPIVSIYGGVSTAKEALDAEPDLVKKKKLVDYYVDSLLLDYDTYQKIFSDIPQITLTKEMRRFHKERCPDDFFLPAFCDFPKSGHQLTIHYTVKR